MNICLCLPLSVCYCLKLFQMSVTSYLQKPFSQFLYCLGTCHGFSHFVGALSVFKPKTRLREGTQLAVMKHWKVSLDMIGKLSLKNVLDSNLSNTLVF